MSYWDFGRPPADQHDAATHPADDRPYPLGGVHWTGGAAALDIADDWPYPERQRGWRGPGASRPAPAGRFAADQFEGGHYSPHRFVRDQFAGGQPARHQFAGNQPARHQFAGGQFAGEPWPPTPAPAPAPAAWPPQPRRARSRHRATAGPGRRWPAVTCATLAVAAIGGAAAFFLTSEHTGGAAARRSVLPPISSAPSGPAPSAPAAGGTSAPSAGAAAGPPLSAAQARSVLAAYTALNNSANARRDDARLATVETGSSDAIDAGLYRAQRAAGMGPYPAFGPVSATYYIPRTEAARPRWFAVRVANAFASSPAAVSSVEYLVFTQARPGGPWKNAIEPYLLSGASAPQVQADGDGLTTAVAATATALAVPPGRLPAITAASLDGTGSVARPGNLADGTGRRFWQGELPAATVTDRHAPATGTDGEAFALPTTGGGALVFYTDAARLTITPPAGMILRLTVSGFYSPAQPLTSAGLRYLDQFAAYDPPAGAGPPRIIADYSGITGKAR